MTEVENTQSLPESIFGKEIVPSDLDGYKAGGLRELIADRQVSEYTLTFKPEDDADTRRFMQEANGIFIDRDTPYIGERRVNRSKVAKARQRNRLARKARQRNR